MHPHELADVSSRTTAQHVNFGFEVLHPFKELGDLLVQPCRIDHAVMLWVQRVALNVKRHPFAQRGGTFRALFNAKPAFNGRPALLGLWLD